MKGKFFFIISSISYALVLSLASTSVYAIEFNTDVLDTTDRQNIDISRFSQDGYIMPGEYLMQVVVNDLGISPSAYTVMFLEQPDSNKEVNKSLPQACLTSEILNRVGLTSESQKKVTYWNDGQCADLRLLSGVEIRPSLSDGILYIRIPQAWLEYADSSWLPSSQWDNGISGGVFDYNINGTVNKPHKGKSSQSLSYNGTAGFNVGAWRMRADYQGYKQGGDKQFNWNRFYMYRAIPGWRANLSLGENYVNSSIFSSWRYAGISLESDERMLPPKLRGYAPQISGIADTNARVVVSQQERILYDAIVPAGSFTIQDLDSSVRGRLDVKVIEQNGKIKNFQVYAANVPYMTRPGKIRYKFISGRPRSNSHSTEGPVFMSSELSWGINNKWSLYSGGIVAGNYNALAIGLARDLNEFGVVSSDVTQSIASIPTKDTKRGESWRLGYSKNFDKVNTDITFSAYRFSERSYMTMQQYLDARYRNNHSNRDKEQYTISLNKNFEEWKVSASILYDHQTYWDHRTTNRYSLNLNHSFDRFGFKNISAGVSASRSLYQQKGNNTYNDSVFLRLSVPWGTGIASYNSNIGNNRYTNMMGYSDTLNGGLDNYSVNAGMSIGNGQSSQGQFSGFYNHNSPLAMLSGNFSTVKNGYTSFGFSASGGGTVTEKGAALHVGGMNGGTRLLVDTDGVGGVPIDGGRVFTNRWGIGVVTDVSSYYRNTTSVDMSKLPEDMEATRSVVESVLTEGAIGYREFKVLRGRRLFAILSLVDNTYPPFGASVKNGKGRELGIVADSGLVWLGGVNLGESLNVSWNGKIQCVADIPMNLNSAQLLLPCRKVTE